jgi:hypothetical protein
LKHIQAVALSALTSLVNLTSYRRPLRRNVLVLHRGVKGAERRLKAVEKSFKIRRMQGHCGLHPHQIAGERARRATVAWVYWVYAKPIRFPIRANKPIRFIGNVWAYWKNAS